MSGIKVTVENFDEFGRSVQAFKMNTISASIPTESKLVNPSPDGGFASEEFELGPGDMLIVMATDLAHINMTPPTPEDDGA